MASLPVVATQKSTYQVRKKKGLCGTCGYANENPRGVCNLCRTEGQRKAAYKYQSRVVQGLCGLCGERPPERVGQTKCAFCAGKQRQRTTGCDKELYDVLLLAQRGKCAICEAESSNGQRLGADHNHTTGYVRGLLCVRCNQGIGSLKENVDILRAAIAYLELYS